ncbi:MAG: ATP-binding protein [Gammaproteobacteria bacterium]|nr:ATP-binding protein [Gammaproteobacteria bacterium]MDH5802492.1 ATP-binding protein [Gammaproteobacteria bacterium]
MIDFQKIAESGPFVVVKWKNTIGWPLEYVSSNVSSLVGYTAEELIDCSVDIFDLMSDNDLKKIDSQIDIAKKAMVDVLKLDKYTLTHANNDTVWVEEYLTIERNEYNVITGFIGYLLDISGRVETELRLKAVQRDTRAIVDALPDTVLQITKNGELKKYMQPISSVEAEVYINDIFPLDFSTDVVARVIRAIETKEVGVYEYKKTLPDLSTHHYEARFTQKSAEDALVIIRDVTDRKEYEALLKRTVEEVGKTSTEKSKFLTNMSHELRTPLNAIMGFCQLLVSEDEPPQYANDILGASKYLLSLINDILDLSRIEAGKLQLTIEPVSVRSVVNECEKIIEPILKKYKVNYQRKDVPDVWVMADETRLVQVVLNLLNNAIKYNKQDGLVWLSSSLNNDATRFRLIVSDTGIGLGPNQIRKLFRPFERVGAESTEIEGTGLGLALTKNLLEQMQGEIFVHSEPGKGCVFEVELNSIEMESSLPIEAIANKGSGNFKSSLKLRILYIEDNLLNQKLVKAIISKKTTHELFLAINGTDGLAGAKELLPDLILLDINLPDMLGFEVLDRLRQDRSTAHIPVIGISANAAGEDITKALVFDDYLTKPIDIERLLAVIDNIAVINDTTAGKLH